MFVDSDEISTVATSLAERLTALSQTVTTAESCTGGLIAAALTDISGSSDWFHQSIVSYSNSAKINLLNVDAGLLEQHGAVSEPVVCAMATGAQKSADANLAIAVSGIAGPGGGTLDKPVGTVWIAWKYQDNSAEAQCFQLDGDRAAVRIGSVIKALQGAVERLT